MLPFFIYVNYYIYKMNKVLSRIQHHILVAGFLLAGNIYANNKTTLVIGKVSTELK